MLVRVLLLTLCSVAALLPFSSALDNGLALTPQMGWNSWNHFECSINERVIGEMAAAMIETGLHTHGYEYVNIDDCWADYRDAQNRTVPDKKLFPSGMYSLGEYIHGLGLRFGMYSDAGLTTCVGKPGGLGYEVIDALTYAAWGVDYLKYDNCDNQGIKSPLRYWPMHDALNATGRPILFSVCDWQDSAATWAPALGNSWRTTDDIGDIEMWRSVMRNLHENDQWWQYAAPGQWNDPDMLEVGNAGLTHDEYVTHFSLWCLVKSPLILGNDIRNMTADTLAILTNDEVIALNQDALGVQGHLRNSSAAQQQPGAEVWAGPLSDGSVAIVFFNRNDTHTLDIAAQWADVGLGANATAVVRDLWLHEDVGQFTGAYTAAGIAPHASVTVRVHPVEAAERKMVLLRAEAEKREAVRASKGAGRVAAATA